MQQKKVKTRKKMQKSLKEKKMGNTEDKCDQQIYEENNIKKNKFEEG